MHLFHDPSLSVTISINLGVELIHQTRLAVRGRTMASGTATSNTGCAQVLTTVSIGDLSTCVGQRGCSSCTSTTKSTTNSLWLAAERISALLPPREVSSLTLELIHEDSWESRSSVALSLILVDFVDGTVV
jgi:hypothetical protein